MSHHNGFGGCLPATDFSDSCKGNIKALSCHFMKVFWDVVWRLVADNAGFASKFAVLTLCAIQAPVLLTKSREWEMMSDGGHTTRLVPHAGVAKQPSQRRKRHKATRADWNGENGLWPQQNCTVSMPDEIACFPEQFVSDLHFSLDTNVKQ